MLGRTFLESLFGRPSIFKTSIVTTPSTQTVATLRCCVLILCLIIVGLLYMMYASSLLTTSNVIYLASPYSSSSSSSITSSISSISSSSSSSSLSYNSNPNTSPPKEQQDQDQQIQQLQPAQQLQQQQQQQQRLNEVKELNNNNNNNNNDDDDDDDDDEGYDGEEEEEEEEEKKEEFVDIIEEIINWSIKPYSLCFQTSKNKNALVALVTIHDLRTYPYPKSFPSLARINRLLYAWRHNYIYCEFPRPVDLSHKVNWSKFGLIYNLLSLYPYVVWIDADSAFYNNSRNFDPEIEFMQKYSDIHFIVAKESDSVTAEGPDNVNTGVMIFRRHPWVLQFLEALYHKPSIHKSAIDHAHQDQRAVYLYRKELRTDWNKHVVVVDENTLQQFGCFGYRQPNHVIHHSLGNGHNKYSDLVNEVLIFEIDKNILLKLEARCPECLSMRCTQVEERPIKTDGIDKYRTLHILCTFSHPIRWPCKNNIDDCEHRKYLQGYYYDFKKLYVYYYNNQEYELIKDQVTQKKIGWATKTTCLLNSSPPFMTELKTIWDYSPK